MPELSNLVRQRLAVSQVATAHPDADTLTAYLEQLLPASERTQVQDHMAQCSQCREVMAFSMPELAGADGQAGTTLPARRRSLRFWTPALGWAASLAVIAIVATVVLEMPRKPGQNQEKGKAISQATPSSAVDHGPASVAAAPESEGALRVAPLPAETRGAMAKPVLSARLEAPPIGATKDKSAPASVAAGGGQPVNTVEYAYVAGASRGDYLNKQMFASTDAEALDTSFTARELPSAPLPQPPPTQFAGAAVLGSSNQILLSSNNQLAFGGSPPPKQSVRATHTPGPPSSSSHIGFLLTPLEEAKRIFDNKKYISRRIQSTLANNTMGGSGMSQLNPSLDGQNVEVTAAAPLVDKAETAELAQSPAFTSRALASSAGVINSNGASAAVDGAAGNDFRARAAMTSSGWRISGGKLQKLNSSGNWVDGFSASDSPAFAVVNAHGLEIWAGGAHTAVVHSRDGGATWERINLGGDASGAVTAITVSGISVQVRTSDSQTWSSQDGGKTWTSEK